jgi:hypothetical protein
LGGAGFSEEGGGGALAVVVYPCNKSMSSSWRKKGHKLALMGESEYGGGASSTFCS